MSTSPGVALGIASLRDALGHPEPVIGTFVMEFGSHGIAAIAAVAGSRFIFFDMQHTGWSLERVGELLSSCRGLPIAAGIRVPASVPWMIGAALDLGATMIMVPAVRSAAEAERIVTATRYPPAGERAITRNFAHDGYSPDGPAAAALRAADHRVVIFAQIETADGLAAAREIAAVPGIDVLWVGDNDLAAALGVPGDFGSPEFQLALDQVAEAAARSGKSAGFTTDRADVAVSLIRRGYHVIALGNDIKLYANELRRQREAFEEGLLNAVNAGPAGRVTHLQ
jgi:2-keto-3-deoxy-L-rhamnonate aldolase RhmA